MADEDFEEEDVWSYNVKESPNTSSRKAKEHSLFSSSKSSSKKAASTSSRQIPRSNGINVEENGKNHGKCAPLDIPDWSKIYRRGSDTSNAANDKEFGGDDDDDDDDDDEDRVPPHEWIAKKLARSQISSFSVCEGAGRTLKGRDQRKVRNAVLTKTGFLE